ncbi:MarR family winged helix-turn-helix transcriptional regulator [Pseudophaeobacter flagellatus]|uniref:MarR family winged helix-turn-helix transcriptional regulator n=1 Tax=Pseudophaeobacter flagellatus TaxID=2899119 RepID=UPI001E5DDADC|nr:MarR family transcriptional regulator [Pseudophaeobacter flagellatus]MCD9146974.1 MarR family transcriptional regulator [Pseudophaeobacter flagellatus]
MTTGPDHLEEFTPYLMNRIMARYNKGVEEALKEVGITVAQMRALAVLTESGPCTINTLSVLTVIKQPTLSRTLDTMETAGLIRREADSKDSRIRHIQLTETGRQVHETAWPAMLQMREVMLSALSTDDRKMMNDLLLRVFYSIRQHDF